jgi:MFS family permease
VRRSPLLPIFLIVLADVFGLTLVIPLLAIYAERFGASPLQATMLVSIFAAFQLVSGPILGRLSDRFGRKPLLLVSQLGTLGALILMANAQALWVLFLARAIDGATAGNLSIAQAYISDNTAPSDRAKSFGMIGIAFGLGFFIGPFVTGWLAGYGLAAPIWMAAGLSATSILCTTFLLPGGAPPTPPTAAGDGAPAARRVAIFNFAIYGAMLRRPVLGGLLLQMLFYIVSFGAFTSGFALYAERTFRWHDQPFGPRQIGFLFAYSGFLGIILQGGMIGRLVRRFGEPRLVHTGFMTLVIGYAGLAFVHDLPSLLVVATVNAYGNAALRPVLSSLISQTAGRHEQGTAMGVSQSLNSIGQIIAPIIAGLLIGHGLLGTWAIAAGAAALVGLLLGRIGAGRVALGEAKADASAAH